MAFSFIGKNVLITGAGKGIGRALAQEIAKAGGEVFAISRTKETLDTLAAEVPKIHPIPADVSDWKGMRKILEKLDTMDCIVNNAAYRPTMAQRFVDAVECSKEQYELAIDTNVLAAINIIQTTAKKLIARGEGGSIVNVSSVLGLSPIYGFSYYNISKAALDMVTKQFALELGPHQIRVNTVSPGMVATLTTKEMIEYPNLLNAVVPLTPMGRICTEKDCIGPIMYLLSDHASMVNGTIQVIDGGLISRYPV